jgi:hypothetical protein
MIREVETLDGVGLRAAALSPGGRPPVESVEAEINRLTWSVLDGSATASDRARLTELVRSQHLRRRRTA